LENCEPDFCRECRKDFLGKSREKFEKNSENIFQENPGKNFWGNCFGKNLVKSVIAEIEIVANGILLESPCDGKTRARLHPHAKKILLTRADDLMVLVKKYTEKYSLSHSTVAPLITTINLF
jgi:hypothetical protein